jgi:penicillin-binding protein 2
MAVVVENSGFGSTWAAPIASLMIEKYLYDTLRTERVKEVDRIAAADLVPSYFTRLQYIEDSTRAQRLFKLTNDSIYLKRFFQRGRVESPKDEPDPSEKRKKAVPHNNAILDERKYPRKRFNQVQA